MLDFNSIFGYVFLIFIGFNIGVLSGFFGIGGCFLLTPLLNILGLPIANAIGTGLVFSIIVSFLGGVKHYFAGNTIIKIALIVGFFSMIGVRISQPIVIYLDDLNKADSYILLVYIFLLIGLGILTLMKKQKDLPPLNTSKNKWIEAIQNLPPLINYKNDHKISLWVLISIALFVGFAQGFLGVGGGFILVPIFILILNMKTYHAVGTSLFTILISAFFASYLYMLSGKVILVIAGLLGFGSFFGVNLGVKMIRRIEADRLRYFFAVFLILSSFGIILKAIHLNILSMIYTLGLCFSVTLFIILKYYFQLKLFKNDRT